MDVFSEPPWEFILGPRGRESRWQFKHRATYESESMTTIRRGNREGINRFLRLESHRRLKRVLMIVQRDGGEVLVEGIVCKKNRSPNSTLLKLFERFEV